MLIKEVFNSGGKWLAKAFKVSSAWRKMMVVQRNTSEEEIANLLTSKAWPPYILYLHMHTIYVMVVLYTIYVMVVL